MEQVTIFVIVILLLEGLLRYRQCQGDDNLQILLWKGSFWQCKYFLVSYLLCVGTIFLEIRKMSFFQSKFIRLSIRLLHSLDGFIALLLGRAIYLRSDVLLCFGLLCITKGFLLHLLSRTVTGVKSSTKWEITLQLTKTFIHHTSSFYFLPPRLNVILITSIWRFISMNGHALLTFRKKQKDSDWGNFSLSEETYYFLSWQVAHLRNLIVLLVLLLCVLDKDLRTDFGKHFSLIIDVFSSLTDRKSVV